MSQKKDAPKQKRRAPATTPEARENQLIALAVDLAEKQLSEGTATSQVMTHYLKLATTREQIEKEKLREEVRLLKAKTESMASAERIEKMYEEALDAMRTYSGHEIVDDDDIE